LLNCTSLNSLYYIDMTIIRNHYQMNHHRASSEAQTGAVLLMFLLILVTGASFSLLNQLNAATNLHTRQQATSRALAEVKQSLISYAVTYPERSGTADITAGPGYMSCPDTNNNGSPNTPCGLSAVGRFPGEFLNVSNYLDSSGERLWYAVSDDFRDNTGALFQPMNSDVPGQLTVDSIADIVAVIIAPGESSTGQNRPSNNIADYLEGDNATTGDNRFTLNSGGNDVLTYITRQELMAVIEKRVLAEAGDTINAYQATYSAFPWLSPFADPSTSMFRGVPTTTFQGHIPFHWANDPDSIVVGTGSNIVGRNPFQSIVGWIWHTDVGTATEFVSGTVTADCLRNVDCIDGTFPQLAQVTTPLNDCTWTDKDTINCTPASSVLMSSITCDFGCGDFTCTREYLINIPAFTGTSSINNPTNTTTRTRDVTLNGSLPIQTAAVTIVDRYIGDNPFTSCLTTTIREIGNGVIYFTGSTTGTLQSTSIQYDLDIDNDELPEWFVANDWQDLVYVAYASGEALPGDTTAGQDCVSLATSCITVNINGIATNNVRVAVVSAGVDLTPDTVRPNGTLTDYFDSENSNPVDDSFVKNRITAIYNDQTRIVSTAP